MKRHRTNLKLRSWFSHPRAMLFRAALQAGNPGLAKWFTKRPQTFYEKLRHKMVYDRNPQLIVFADKIKAKEFVKSRIGSQFVAAELQIANHASEIDFRSLPREFAAKVSHASGGIILVSEDARRRTSLPPIEQSLAIIEVHPDDLNSNYLARQLNLWLSVEYGHSKGEWAYSAVKPRILIEELLEFENNRPPVDYRFFMFQGRLGIIIRDQQRGQSKLSNIYSAELTPLLIEQGSLLRPVYEAETPPPELPASIHEMVQLATVLSHNIDFVRVDMFAIDNRIYVGELTNYPLAGMGRFSPRSFDRQLGALWR